MVGDPVELVVCAAPLAEHTPRIARALVHAGYLISVVASTNAIGWFDADSVEADTGLSPVLAPRSPFEPRTRPRPVATLAVPATFNTLNKLRAGISDTPALGSLNDAMGSGSPILVAPMISERLAGHPAWRATHGWLIDTGAAILDPVSGRFDRLDFSASGSGQEAGYSFEPAWLTDWLLEVL